MSWLTEQYVALRELTLKPKTQFNIGTNLKKKRNFQFEFKNLKSLLLPLSLFPVFIL